jgi:hypothetical protein
MTNLPIFQTKDKSFALMQQSWKAAITPVIQNELNQGLPIQNIELAIGDNVINHLLSRKQLGWMITDIDGSAVIFRSAALNDKTLTLNSTAAVIVNLWVF